MTKRRADFWTLVTLGAFFLVIVFLLYPLSDVFRYSFTNKETGALDLSNWSEFFSRMYYIKAFGNSMVVAISTTLISVAFGVPLAFFTTRYRIRGSSVLTNVAVLA